MRTTIIPAQMTTVEDKIAGSLNFVQILLLMTPILWGTLIYTVCTPVMKIVPYKIGLVLFATIACLILAMRIKEKIVAEWIGVLFRYKLRPKYYVFTKNDLTERVVDLPFVESVKNFNKISVKHIKKYQDELSITERIKLEHAMNSRNLAVSFLFERKGRG